MTQARTQLSGADCSSLNFFVSQWPCSSLSLRNVSPIFFFKVSKVSWPAGPGCFKHKTEDQRLPPSSGTDCTYILGSLLHRLLLNTFKKIMIFIPLAFNTSFVYSFTQVTVLFSAQFLFFLYWLYLICFFTYLWKMIGKFTCTCKMRQTVKKPQKHSSFFASSLW